jgi:hypothetical protein
MARAKPPWGRPLNSAIPVLKTCKDRRIETTAKGELTDDQINQIISFVRTLKKKWSWRASQASGEVRARVGKASRAADGSDCKSRRKW